MLRGIVVTIGECGVSEIHVDEVVGIKGAESGNRSERHAIVIRLVHLE